MVRGQLFDGKYKILGILGQGGMGTVYLAENIKLGTLWAIKEIKRNSNSKSTISVEPEILKKLNHPALPRIFDIVEDDESIYIVVDYIDGVSLDIELSKEGKFGESKVLEWAREICGVLIYLHGFSPNPIIYRDMKPSNIILTRDGSIKLIDFGIAREYKEGSGNDTVYIGTKGYAAPEQYGAGQTNAATDIYSLGVTLYYLLTGKSPNEPPYAIKPARQFDNSISENLERVILKCTKQDPEERYQSAKELLDDINAIFKASKAGIEDGQPEKPSGIKTNRKHVVSFRKQVLCVYGNSELACEMAVVIARKTDYSVLLVDLDTLNATADMHLNVDTHPVKIRSYNDPVENTGLNILMDAIDKKIFSRELFLDSLVHKGCRKNLNILTGNYNIANFEYYNDENLSVIIEKAYEIFDITILSVSRFIYDSFTVISLIKSDANIMAINANKMDLREINRYLVFLSEKQNIPLEKSKFVAFEYKQGLQMKESILKELTEGNYLGKISYNRKREIYRNLKASYAFRLDRYAVREYMEVLGCFNIFPRYNFIDNISDSVKDTVNRAARSLRKTLSRLGNIHVVRMGGKG